MKLLKQYKGRFRVEFLACLPELSDFITKGYSAPMIYDEMHSTGKITMSYGQFYRYFKAEFSLKPQEKSEHNISKSAPNLPAKVADTVLPAPKAHNNSASQEGSNAITQVAATAHNLLK